MSFSGIIKTHRSVTSVGKLGIFVPLVLNQKNACFVCPHNITSKNVIRKIYASGVKDLVIKLDNVRFPKFKNAQNVKESIRVTASS